MNRLRTGGVEERRDMMPRIGGKALKRNPSAFPLFRREIEDAPRIARVICLPGEVVGISIRGLLALEFYGLRSIRKFGGNEDIHVVAQIADRIGNRGLLDEVVASGVRRTAVDKKVCCRSTEAGARNTLAHVIIGSLSHAPDIPAATAGLPPRLRLKAGVNNRTRRI